VSEYTVEVLEAASREHTKEVEGYGTYPETHLICLMKEAYTTDEFMGECYVITVFNESRKKEVLHADGKRRHIVRDEQEAQIYYRNLVYPERKAA
jgi:hypothetical protein